MSDQYITLKISYFIMNKIPNTSVMKIFVNKLMKSFYLKVNL